MARKTNFFKRERERESKGQTFVGSVFRQKKKFINYIASNKMIIRLDLRSGLFLQVQLKNSIASTLDFLSVVCLKCLDGHLGHVVDSDKIEFLKVSIFG